MLFNRRLDILDLSSNNVQAACQKSLHLALLMYQKYWYILVYLADTILSSRACIFERRHNCSEECCEGLTGDRSNPPGQI